MLETGRTVSILLTFLREKCPEKNDDYINLLSLPHGGACAVGSRGDVYYTYSVWTTL